MGGSGYDLLRGCSLFSAGHDRCNHGNRRADVAVSRGGRGIKGWWLTHITAWERSSGITSRRVTENWIVGERLVCRIICRFGLNVTRDTVGCSFLLHRVASSSPPSSLSVCWEPCCGSDASDSVWESSSHDIWMVARLRMHFSSSCVAVPELQAASWRFEWRGKTFTSTSNFLEGERSARKNLKH